MDREEAHDEPANSPEEHWMRSTFYVVLDTVVGAIKNTFVVHLIMMNWLTNSGKDLKNCLKHLFERWTELFWFYALIKN